MPKQRPRLQNRQLGSAELGYCQKCRDFLRAQTLGEWRLLLWAMGASVALSCQADVTKLDHLLDTHGASALGQQVREPRCPSYLAYLFSCHLTRGCVQAPCAKLQQQLIDSLARVKGALRGSVSFSECVLHLALPAIRLWER